MTDERTYLMLAQYLQKKYDCFGVKVGIEMQEYCLMGPKIVYQYKGLESKVSIPVHIWSLFMCGQNDNEFFDFVNQSINSAMIEISKHLPLCLPSGRNAYLTYTAPERPPQQLIPKEYIDIIKQSFVNEINGWINKCNRDKCAAWQYPDSSKYWKSRKIILDLLESLKQ